MYRADVGPESYIYAAELDYPEGCIYSADIGSEGYMYTLDVGLVPNEYNAGVPYIGPKGFIYATSLLLDCCIP